MLNKPHRQEGISFLVENKAFLLDFLLLNLPHKSRNNVKNLLSRKQVFVDGRAFSQFDMLLKPGQQVSILSGTVKSSGSLDIIYEDEYILAINKPAGLLSMSSGKAEGEDTAYSRATKYVREKDRRMRIFIVHRLDKDTSGVLIFAKHEHIKFALQDNWEKTALYRGYLAVVCGVPDEKEKTLTSYLKESSTHMVYLSQIPGDGLLAITHYRVIKEEKGNSLLDIKIDTGRKNQIRVQLSALGYPVAGDKKYGKTDKSKATRLMLHAHKLSILHPHYNRELVLEANIPEDFNRYFTKLNEKR